MLKELGKWIQHCRATLRWLGTKEMLGVVGRKVWPVSNFAHQHATTSNNMQQGVETDATYNIQQCRELLANNVASVCTGLKRICLEMTQPFDIVHMHFLGGLRKPYYKQHSLFFWPVWLNNSHSVWFERSVPPAIHRYRSSLWPLLTTQAEQGARIDMGGWYVNGSEVPHTFRGRWIPSKILPKIPVKFFYQQQY